MRIFLSSYSVRVNQKSERDGDKKKPIYRKLNAFDGHTDLYDIVLGFLKSLKSNTTNNTYKTYMDTVSIHVSPEKRQISGVIESGVYGISSNIRDVETNIINYKKTKNDADVLPFYFLFCLPKETNEGFLLLQRTGKFGIRTNLGNLLETHLCKKHRGFSLEINTLVQEELIKDILHKGVIKKLRCVKYNAPIDKFDGLDEGHKEIPFSVEMVLSANRIPFANKIKRFFGSDKSDVRSLIEVRDFNYDTVKVEVEIDGSMRVFDLGCLQKARSYYDISDQVKMDADEQPNFSSINEIAQKYLDEIIQKVYP